MTKQEQKLKDISMSILRQCRESVEKVSENAVQLSDSMHKGIDVKLKKFHEQFAPIEEALIKVQQGGSIKFTVGGK